MNINHQYWIYFGNLEDAAIISLIRSTNNSRSIKSIIVPSIEIGDYMWKHVRKLLSENKIEKKDLSRCYVNIGPAKFNSTRLITLAAKSWSHFNHIPLYSITNLYLHSLAYQSNIALIADSKNFFVAWKSDSTNMFYEDLVKKEEIEKYKKDMQITNLKLVNILSKKDHEITVLKYLNNFDLVKDASKLAAHYIKDPIEIEK